MTLARSLSAFLDVDPEHIDQLISGGCTNRANDPTQAQRKPVPHDLAEAYAAIGTTALAKREGVSRKTVKVWLQRHGIEARRKHTPKILNTRPCPANFRDVFVQSGWEGASAEFRADHRTIKRWLDESGRDGIILARTLVLKRRAGGRKQRSAVEAKIAPELAHKAAQFLQRHFRPVYSLAIHHRQMAHMYQVGGRTMTDVEMVQLARRKGWR